MKKFGLILGLLIMSGNAVTINGAESNEKKQTTIELTPFFGLQEGSKMGLSANLNFLYPVAKNALWGAGIGFQTASFDFDYLGIPIYTRGKVYFKEKDNSARPYISLDLGYTIPLQGGIDNGSVLIAPSLGVDLGGLTIGVGYRRDQSVKASYGSDALFVSIGAKLGGKSTFLSKTDFTVEAVADFALINHTKEIVKTSETVKTTSNGSFGIKLAWTYPFTENFSAGIGSGFIYSDIKSTTEYTQWSYDSKHSFNGIPLYLRGNYKIKNIKIGKAVPYINLDLGCLETTDYDLYLTLNPSVGLAFPVKDSHSFNIGVGLNSLISLDEETTYSGSTDIGARIGYTF